MHNRQLKKFIAVILSIVVVLGTVVSAFAADAKVLGTSNAPKTAFPDMRAESHWAYKALAYAINNNLLKGSDGKLYPERNITRAEMAALVNRVFGATEEADISKYTDINKAKDWFYSDMAKSVQMKMFGGVSATEMNPNGKLTRQDAFVVLARALKLSLDDLSALAQFSDSASIADYAKANIAAMVAAGYVNGSDGKINPLGNITREEVAQIFYNIFTEFVSEAGTVTGDKKGTVLVNVPGVTIKDANVDGDIIIGDGVGDGECTLDNVKLTGRLLVRGGGANSIKIINGSSVGNVIVSKTASGAVRVYCEKGALVSVLRIDDGSDDIKVEGSFVSVEVQTDTQVNLANADVNKLSINAAGANVNIESGTIAEVSVAQTAVAAEIKTGKESTIGLMTINADVKVDAAGTITKTEAAENVVVEGIEVGKEIKPATETPSTGGGGGFVPTPSSSTVAAVTTKNDLTKALEDEKIEKVEITKSFELEDQIRFGGLKEKEVVVASGITVTLPGISVGTNAKFTNNGTIYLTNKSSGSFCEVYNTSIGFVNNGLLTINNGYLYVESDTSFECKGTLKLSGTSSYATILGTLEGTGTFEGNDGSIIACGNAVISWPTNINIQERQEYYDLYSGNNVPQHIENNVTFGANVRHALPKEERYIANIRDEQGYTTFKEANQGGKYQYVHLCGPEKITVDANLSVKEFRLLDAADVEIAAGTTVSTDYLQIAYKEDEQGNFVSSSVLTNKGTLVLGNESSDYVHYINFGCKLINDSTGTIEQKSGCLRVAGDASFENNGTFKESAPASSARVRVFGTITGSGIFDGLDKVFDGSFCAHPGAKVYWPTTVTYAAFNYYEDRYYGKDADDNYIESNSQKNITFGSGIKHDAQPKRIVAYIYSQEGYNAFINAVSQGKQYDSVYIYDCSLDIDSSISFDTIAFYRSNVTVKQETAVVTANSIYIYDNSVLTNNGTLAIGNGTSEGHIEVGHGSIAGKLVNNANGTIVLNKVSWFEVGKNGQFTCNGTLKSDDASSMTISGTIAGSGVYSGEARIGVRGGATVNWPTNVKFNIVTTDQFRGGGNDSISEDINFGSSIPSQNKSVARYANIYSQEGFSKFLEVSANRSYTRVSLYDAKDLAISGTVNAANEIYFYNSSANIASGTNLITDQVRLINAVVTNAGIVSCNYLSINDGYDFDNSTQVYTEGACTLFINEGNVTLKENASLIINGEHACLEHKQGKFIAQGSISVNFGGKLKIDTPVTSDATATNLFSVESGNSTDVTLSSYILNNKTLQSSIEGGEGLIVRKNATIYDASRLPEIGNAYDIVYAECDLDINNDMEIDVPLNVNKLTIKASKKLVISCGGMYYSTNAKELIVEEGASLIVATGTNLQIGSQHYNSATDTIEGTFGYTNNGSITNYGTVSLNCEHIYGNDAPVLNIGTVLGKELFRKGVVVVKSKNDLINVLKATPSDLYDINYYGSLEINPQDNFPVIEKSIYFYNGNLDVAEGVSFIVSGSSVVVYFENSDSYKTNINGTLKLVNNPQVVIYDSTVNNIENDGRLFISGNMKLEGTLNNKKQVVVQNGSTLNSYKAINNEAGAVFYVGRPGSFGGNNPTKGDVAILDGSFNNSGRLHIINGSSVIASDGTSFVNNEGASIKAEEFYQGQTQCSTGTLTINSGVNFTNSGTIDSSNGLTFNNHKVQ